MSYTPSNVVSIFLTEFHPRNGYKLVWSRSTIPDFDFTGLDYKSMPSGVHEYGKSTVLISHTSQDKLYYGICKFRQHLIGEDTHDRNNIKIYSLGIICQPSESLFKPNEFINNGWEFIGDLDHELLKYLQEQKYEDFAVFEKLFESLCKPSSNLLPLPNAKPVDVTNHPLTKLPQLFKTFGPLVFVLYKQALLRKRILIFNQHHIFHDDEDLLPNEDSDLLLNLSTFCYLVSLVSIIPQDIEIASQTYSQPIYSIGLNDLTGDLVKIDNYIGTTNDDILIENKVYDIGVMIDDKVTIFPMDDKNNII
ncbi:uncharacterized protein SPAPADRAFT_61761, partial [Spathaspora passalidarum NRRL Y-27907]